MVARAVIPQSAPALNGLPPPLENGDRLTREEFERRYDATPNLRKAELIEGEVHVPSPIRFDRHGAQMADLLGWMVAYRAATPGTSAGDNSTLRLDEKNELQPDAVMIIDPAVGGRAVITPDGYLEGSLELAAEVASSRASIDLHKKLKVYQRHRVREYIVWRVLDNAIDWFVLRKGKYKRLRRKGNGYFASEVFPGLWLDPDALAKRDMARVLEVLQQGLATSEHAAFVAHLRAAARTR
jgi:hypothetical protein